MGNSMDRLENYTNLLRDGYYYDGYWDLLCRISINRIGVDWFNSIIRIH